jgi:sugar lactone lactonase YvrE
MKKRSLLLFLSLLVFAWNGFAQQIPIGGWKTHLPYSQGLDVVEVGSKIYCASERGLFYLDRSDNSLNVISKLDGLAEVSISAIAYDETTGSLIVGYQNANIDIIRGNKILNVSDIKVKDIIGNKTIISISVSGGVAYINCGFGTVVYDLQKMEVRDTYILGEGGQNLAVYEVLLNEGKVYAATDSGILEANAGSANLADYQAWRRHDASDAYPGGRATHIVLFNSQLYAMIANHVYRYRAGAWEMPAEIYQDGRERLRSQNNKLLVSGNNLLSVYDTDLATTKVYHTPGWVGSLRSVINDKNNQVWVADGLKGLQLVTGEEQAESFFPGGPFDVLARRLWVSRSNVLVAGGSLGDNYGNQYTYSGFYKYRNYHWDNYNYLNTPGMDTVYDVSNVIIHPSNGYDYVGTFGRGLYVYNNSIFVNQYNPVNSSLQDADGNPGNYRISGMGFDSKNNLWISNHWAAKPISVLKSNGQWESYEFPGVFPDFKYVSDLIVDRNDQKWVVLPKLYSILVFKENANGTVTYKKLGKGVGSGNMPVDGSEVYSLCEDLDGKIWVGTNRGIVVFYSPSNILKVGADIDAQPIRVVDGEFVQLLLENETVTAIAVDGANRKWVGTRNGVWLFSPDGGTQILYFNEKNSPLLSNRINDIKIDQQTGEVYIATENGMISYRGTAVAGGATNASEIRVFPNPVRENYSGMIAIKGLVRNARVKITDINGGLVYQTTAEGGQAVWNGKNFSGERVSTGVYMVLCTDTEGAETLVEKILFIH